MSDFVKTIIVVLITATMSAGATISQLGEKIANIDKSVIKVDKKLERLDERLRLHLNGPQSLKDKKGRSLLNPRLVLLLELGYLSFLPSIY